MKRALLLSVLVAVACGDDDSPTQDASVATDAAPVALDFGPAPMCSVAAPADPSCIALPTDYTPGADDMWAPCISDDGEYHRIQESISSIQRVRAFEAIATLIFDPATTPSSEAFVMARTLYQEEEGLDSRVARRYDPRFAVPEGTDCTQPATAAELPEYCIGPSTLQPLILSALNAGIEGTDPLAGARVEAGLIWFLYVSTNKEAYSCTTTPKDCDSSYAYYTGGETDRGGIGFARYVREVAPAAHDRAWDGVLAVRCWRDLDPADTAADLEMRDRARAQLDTAITHGLAQVVRARLSAICEAADGREAAYHWTFVRTLAPALFPTLSDADRGTLEAAIAIDDPSAVDAQGLADLLDAAYECP